MTPRPQPVKSRARPSSAIFIGSLSSTSSSPALSDLPEPPSPSTSVISRHSGLPSPPATNSTGSGSTGDRHSTDAGSLRGSSASRFNTTTSDMTNGDKGPARSRSTSLAGSWSKGGSTDDEDDPFENENEDNTARLSGGRRGSKASLPEDNVSALQRVRNLTERNRMVLNKLTSISRLNSPSPAVSRSPIAPPSANSSSAASRVSTPLSRPPSAAGAAPIRRLDSGSETERESQRASLRSYPSSDELSSTPPSVVRDIDRAVPVRERRISAPASPAKVARPTRDRDRAPSPGPSRPPRKRVSMAMSVDEGRRYPDEEDDVTSAALAAVASSRRSPTDTISKRSRAPLPKEFRERDRRSLDGKANGESSSTPRRQTDRGSNSTPPTEVTPLSPRRSASRQFSTVRELTRKHQTRWMSEDLSVTSGDADDDAPPSGRRQGPRGGSAEGLMAGGRSLLGEGLRAAGLTKRREASEDVFASGSGTTPVSRTRSTGTSSVNHEATDRSVDQGRGPGSGVRFRDGSTSAWSSQYDLRTPDVRQAGRGGVPSRPGTSMAALHHDSFGQPPQTAPPALRAFRSAQLLPDRETMGSRQEVLRTAERTYSPYGAPPLRTAPLTSGLTSGSGRDASGEHRRLMLESLTMFESQLSRLPPMGETSTNTIPELFQSAQHLVHTLDKLNGMLKAGTNRALEEQIDAEVAEYGDTVDLVEIWRRVGAEHREHLRASDEVVRNMTGFLLGVGRVLRDAYAHNQHVRSVSLDDSAIKASTRECSDRVVGGGRSSDGRQSRQSRETRHSWDPRDSRKLRLSSLERNGDEERPSSSMKLLRGPGTTSSGRSSEATREQALGTRTSGSVLASSARRLLAAREGRHTPEHVSGLPSLDTSFDSQDMYEPSPTPTARYSAVSERPRASIPPALSTLPSESLLNRSHTIATDKPTRRKISSNSNVTVRPDASPYNSIIKPPSATTALTPASATNSPDTPLSILRSDSSDSNQPNGVTFSRPSTISSSTLSNLQQQHQRDPRKRTVSELSSAEPSPKAAPLSLRSPMTGSDTERDIRRKTIGARSRVSLDSAIEEAAAEGDFTPQTLTGSSTRRERRRTITEIFAQRT